MKFLSIVGTRPQYIKLSAIQRAFDTKKIQHFYIDSGQHYDPELSSKIVKDLYLPDANKILKPGFGKPTEQIANLLIQISEALDELKPQYVLVYGDTNTTLAAAISCAKLNIPFAHVEAGLRSFNLNNQEEKNRLVVDHLANILFAPTEQSEINLQNEGLGNRTRLVGDVMVDVLYRGLPYSLPAELQKYEIRPNSFYIATLHRAENVDSKKFLTKVMMQFSEVEKKIILFAHPRLEKKMNEFGLEWSGNILKLPPVTHTEILKWMSHSCGLITDSGGLQKEAFLLKIPCTTLRSETEWTETLSNNWNILLPEADDLNAILKREVTPTAINPFGDGHAADNIVSYVQEISQND